MSFNDFYCTFIHVQLNSVNESHITKVIVDQKCNIIRQGSVTYCDLQVMLSFMVIGDGP